MEKPVKMKLKKGDKIVVIAGKEKGKQGEISKISPATKPNQQTGEGGGLIPKEAPIHASNVMLIDAKTQKPTRKRAE
jgi:large subunit ribosomal protein L24